ncbi:MAG: hypothetical protein J0M12_17110, partial [Deltaproteobacteria bacterium]|nr:hypothetical protein [Deltaproteobacteria bacterium]
GKTVEVLYQVEALAEELVEKYDLQCEVDRLIKSQGGYDLYRNTKLSKEDRARLVSLTTEANIQLGKLFVFVPDTTYEFVHDAVPTAKGSLRDFRDFALLALRKGLNPGTKFKSREDIRSYSFGKTECHENK